jgi:hypothetical protein
MGIPGLAREEILGEVARSRGHPDDVNLRFLISEDRLDSLLIWEDGDTDEAVTLDEVRKSL